MLRIWEEVLQWPDRGICWKTGRLGKGNETEELGGDALKCLAPSFLNDRDLEFDPKCFQSFL